MFKKETLDKKNEAEELIRKMRKDQILRLRAEFDARESEKDVRIVHSVRRILTNHVQRIRVGRRKGKPAKFKTYVKEHTIRRSNRDTSSID